MYVGVTNDRTARAGHRESRPAAFTTKNNNTRLVYFEEYDGPIDNARQKEANERRNTKDRLRSIDAGAIAVTAPSRATVAGRAGLTRDWPDPADCGIARTRSEIFRGRTAGCAVGGSAGRDGRAYDIGSTIYY